jgi:hypothetical protein
MATPEIRMYHALTPCLGEENARTFIQTLNESIVQKMEYMKQDLATKSDLLALKADFHGLKQDFHSLKEEFYKLRLDLGDQIAKLRTEMGQLRVENIKYICIVGFIQVVLIIGSLVAIIKAMR